MVVYEVAAPRAVVTIDDPERRNPMSNEVMTGLAEALQRASDDPLVRAVVFTGAGKTFSAGGDLAGGFIDSPAATHRERGALADLIRLDHQG